MEMRNPRYLHTECSRYRVLSDLCSGETLLVFSVGGYISPSTNSGDELGDRGS